MRKKNEQPSRTALTAYMKNLHNHPRLNKEETAGLGTGATAMRRLVEGNLRLVVSAAKEYGGRSRRDLDDLIQAGNVGLVIAAQRYDAGRAVTFSTYALIWIRSTMLNYIINNKRLVKVGTSRSQRKLFWKLKQMRDGETSAEFAAKLNVSEQDVDEMRVRMGTSERSMDAPIGTREDGSAAGTRYDVIGAQDADQHELTYEKDRAERLHSVLSRFEKQLQGLELQLFRRRLIAEDQVTLEVLGEEFGLSRQRVQQREASLKKQLKYALELRLERGTVADAEARREAARAASGSEVSSEVLAEQQHYEKWLDAETRKRTGASDMKVQAADARRERERQRRARKSALSRERKRDQISKEEPVPQ
jgi:RNA polymerase sigma-32 factor